MRSKLIFLTALISALVGVQARADFAQFGTFSVIDGHGPNGTHQTWDAFADPGVPGTNQILDIDADHDDNPYGAPTASIFALTDPLSQNPDYVFGPTLGTGTVYASPRMEIVLSIPNVINPDLVKIVQATLVYQTQQNPDSGYESAFLVPEGDSALDPIAGVETTTNGWTTLKLEWQFPQIYESEQITVLLHDSGVTLDRIVVETQCVPVPGAVLLGLLGLAAAGRKLRRVC